MGCLVINGSDSGFPAKISSQQLSGVIILFFSLPPDYLDYFSLSRNHLSFSRNRKRLLLPICISYRFPTPPAALVLGRGPERTFVISYRSVPSSDSQRIAVGMICPSFCQRTSTSTYFFLISFLCPPRFCLCRISTHCIEAMRNCIRLLYRVRKAQHY